MTKKPLNPQIYEKLEKAEEAFESGRISRRSFNKILTLAAASAGVTFAELSPVHAWVATRMRKRKTTSSSSFVSVASCRADSARSCRFTRTPSSSGNRQKWTWSGWVKRGALGNRGVIFNSSTTGSTQTFFLAFDTDDKLYVHNGVQAVSTESWSATTRVFRDPSAWFHLVLSIDTTQATASDRIKMYVNGAPETLAAYSSYSCYPTQNYQTAVNNTGIAHNLFYGFNSTSTGYLDGLVAEAYLIDGQAHLPSAFAQTDSTTGQWIAKQYSGSFGTNGFYLPFKSAAAVTGSGTASGSYPSVTGVSGIGADYSGNNNHWTGSGLAVTDQLLDTPTNNFCVLSLLDKGSQYTLSNGALQAYASGVVSTIARGTIGVTTGKWYYEVKVDTNTNGNLTLGASNEKASPNAYQGSDANGWAWNPETTNSYYYNSGSFPFYGSTQASQAVGMTLGVAIDASAGKIWVAANGTWQASGDPAAGTSPMASTLTTPVFPAIGQYSGGSQTTQAQVNFGQGGQSGLTFDSASGGSFKYTPPTGFKALCTNNLSTPQVVRPSQFFAATLYSGTGSSQTIDVTDTISQVFTVSGAFVVPAYASMTVKVYGAGGGGGGQSAAGGDGTSSSFNTSVIGGGGFGGQIGCNTFSCSNPRLGGAGGTASGGTTNTSGTTGSNGTYGSYPTGPAGPDGYGGGGNSGAFYDGSYYGGGTGGTGAVATKTYALGDLVPGASVAFTVGTGGSSGGGTGVIATAGGNGAVVVTYTLSSSGFAPDLVWIKGKSGATDHALYDTARGATFDLASNQMAVESTQATGLTAFTSSGFTVGSLAKVNTSAASYVAWSWKKGASPGFDVVTYASGTTGDKSISHGLGAVPKFIITKARNDSTYNWSVYHSSATTTVQQWLRLNTTDGIISNGTNCWGSSLPSSSAFGITSGNGVPVSTNCIAYLWSEVPGFSKFGSYTGNGSTDGPFIWCGLRPKYILIRRVDAGGSGWMQFDAARGTYNVSTPYLQPNTAGAEGVGSTYLDILGNGFKIRCGGGAQEANQGSATYIYVAFAEAPFKYANAR